MSRRPPKDLQRRYALASLYLTHPDPQALADENNMPLGKLKQWSAKFRHGTWPLPEGAEPLGYRGNGHDTRPKAKRSHHKAKHKYTKRKGLPVIASPVPTPPAGPSGKLRDAITYLRQGREAMPDVKKLSRSNLYLLLALDALEGT